MIDPEFSEAYREYLQAAWDTKKLEGAMILAARGIIRGPPIEDYTDRDHPIWTNLQWLYDKINSSDQDPPHYRASFEIMQVVEKIRVTCIFDDWHDVNYATRALGLSILIRIFMWVTCVHNHMPGCSNAPEAREIVYAIEEVMDEMELGERQLIAKGYCLIDLMGLFKDLRWYLDGHPEYSGLRIRRMGFYSLRGD